MDEHPFHFEIRMSEGTDYGNATRYVTGERATLDRDTATSIAHRLGMALRSMLVEAKEDPHGTDR